MEKDPNLHFLALQAVRGIGSKGARKLIELFGSPENLLKEKKETLLKVKGLGPGIVKNLKSKTLYDRAETEYERALKANVRLISIFDREYPEMLRHCPDAPILLFCKGKPGLKGQKTISIVGTRKMTASGESFLHGFFKEIVRYDPVIVSGLAYGVDITAHRLALKHGLRTMAVLAHGMDRVYPRAHYATALKMLSAGALLTEFWMGTPPERENFIKRNRIIAGMSEATLVVESSGKGGSLITAELADSYHRDVFAVPGRTSDLFSEGCNHLIKTQKAAMLTRARDLEYALGWEPCIEERPEEGTRARGFSDPVERRVYETLLLKGRLQADRLSAECSTEIRILFPALLRLELKGMIRELSGKHYEIVR